MTRVTEIGNTLSMVYRSVVCRVVTATHAYAFLTTNTTPRKTFAVQFETVDLATLAARVLFFDFHRVCSPGRGLCPYGVVFVHKVMGDVGLLVVSIYELLEEIPWML